LIWKTTAYELSPVKVSAPAPPTTVSLPETPTRESFPEVPVINGMRLLPAAST
jgi:hypothetical protein